MDFQLFQLSTFLPQEDCLFERSNYYPSETNLEVKSASMKFEEFRICEDDLFVEEPVEVTRLPRVNRLQQSKPHPKAKNPRYKKNICGYILKKAVREFVGERYAAEVERICRDNSCSLAEAKAYYLQKVEAICGVSHLKILAVPDCRAEVGIKRAFLTFLQWFLRERYVRHLIEDGRMDDKRAYLQFKNQFFPGAIAGCRAQLEQVEQSWQQDDSIWACLDTFQSSI